MNFNLGEEVICVDNSPGYGYGKPCNLVKGKTYIVLAHCPICQTCGCIAVNQDEQYWDGERFRRPQVDKDIALVCNEVEV